MNIRRYIESPSHIIILLENSGLRHELTYTAPKTALLGGGYNQVTGSSSLKGLARLFLTQRGWPGSGNIYS